MMQHRTLPALGPHGFHRIAYTEWGEPDRRDVLVCVHGLTRNGRDFDDLARALEDRWRVLCPDVAGRGQSEWLARKEDYSYPVYLGDMAQVIARSGAESVDWVGTSMGGIIGMMLAATPGSPIRRLVLNDVGSTIPRASLERIGQYVGRDPRFESLAALTDYIRQVAAPFGRLTDAQWEHLARHSAANDPDGTWRLSYDPAIALPFKAAPIQDVDLTPVWNAVRCPVLILRGVDSDLLLPETARAMVAGRANARLVEVPGCGHAPALMDPWQIEVIREFLSEG